MRQKFLKRISTHLSSSIYSQFLPFIIQPFITKYLSPADYGLYSLSIILSGISSTLSSSIAGYIFYSDFNTGLGAAKVSGGKPDNSKTNQHLDN